MINDSLIWVESEPVLAVPLFLVIWESIGHELLELLSFLQAKEQEDLDCNWFDANDNEEEEDVFTAVEGLEDAADDCASALDVDEADIAFSGLGDRFTGGDVRTKWFPFSYNGSFCSCIVVDVEWLLGTCVDCVTTRLGWQLAFWLGDNSAERYQEISPYFQVYQKV